MLCSRSGGFFCRQEMTRRIFAQIGRAGGASHPIVTNSCIILQCIGSPPGQAGNRGNKAEVVNAAQLVQAQLLQLLQARESRDADLWTRNQIRLCIKNTWIGILCVFLPDYLRT